MAVIKICLIGIHDRADNDKGFWSRRKSALEIKSPRFQQTPLDINESGKLLHNSMEETNLYIVQNAHTFRSST